MVHPHSGILLSNKKEQTTDIGKHIHESQKLYAKWKKSEIMRKEKFWDINQINSYQGLQVGKVDLVWRNTLPGVGYTPHCDCGGGYMIV